MRLGVYCVWVLLIGGCALQRAAAPVSSAAPLATGGVLDFTLPRFPSGAPLTFANMRGKVVLLDVWATWCEPCAEALPQYQSLAAELKDQPFEVVTISVDEDVNELSRFVTQRQLSLAVLRDPNAALSERLLQVKLMPTSVLVDKRGYVRQQHEGALEDVAALKAQIQALLWESP